MATSFLVRHIPRRAQAVHEEWMTAESAEQLRTSLTRAGGVVLELKAAGRTQLGPQTGIGRARFDVPWWCREMVTLLRAGMTPVEAIETIAAGSALGDAHTLHAKLLEALSAGAALSSAMRGTGAFPDMLVAGVVASERTSTLADALEEYLRYDALLQRLRRQVLSAALYPALVIGLGALIATFLLLYVIPRFSRMYDTFEGAVSGPTAFVLALSRGLSEFAWPLFAVGAALLGLAVWWIGTGRLRGRALVDFLGGVPVLRGQVDRFRLAQFYQAIALLLRGGYTADEALRLVGGMGLGGGVGAAVERAREAVANGEALSSSLRAAGLADAVVVRLLAVGERGGGFAQVAQTVAERHALAFSTFVERAIRLAEPLLLLVVAVVVGGIVVLMYMPIFDIAGGLGGLR